MGNLFSGITIGTLAAAAFGIALVARCEVGPQPPGGWVGCWLVGGMVAGVPGLARAAEQVGYMRGFNTYNPGLRKPEDHGMPPPEKEEGPS